MKIDIMHVSRHPGNSQIVGEGMFSIFFIFHSKKAWSLNEGKKLLTWCDRLVTKTSGGNKPWALFKHC